MLIDGVFKQNVGMKTTIPSAVSARLSALLPRLRKITDSPCSSRSLAEHVYIVVGSRWSSINDTNPER